MVMSAGAAMVMRGRLDKRYEYTSQEIKNGWRLATVSAEEEDASNNNLREPLG